MHISSVYNFAQRKRDVLLYTDIYTDCKCLALY